MKSKLLQLSENPGRFEIHKALGTYHFDKTSDQIDYEYFGRIEMPDEWWQDGLNAIISRDKPVPVTTTNVVKAINAFDSDIGQKGLANDYNKSDIPFDDPWFDRFLVDDDSVFQQINNFFHITDPVIRIADQVGLGPVPIHIDHEHSQILQTADQQYNEHTMDIEAAYSSRGNAKKFLIAMHDFSPEIVIYLGNTLLPTLKQGDIISWKYAVPHWTVNFSKEHRYMLGIIGTIDKQFYLDKFNFDYESKTSMPTPVFEGV
jgi:hypothetical protein